LISLIAIIVASCSDFSMIERPPVSENKTPTLTSPAARAPVLKTHGEVISEPPASNPFFRNLRLSTAITQLPFVQARLIVRAEARCSVPKFIQIRSIAENATASAAVLDPQNKKARQILTDLSGYLARARLATLMVRRVSRNITRP